MQEALSGTDWRQPVLEVVLIWAVRVGLVPALMVVTFALSGHPDRIGLPMVGAMLLAYAAMIAARYNPSWPLRRRATLLALTLVLLGSLGAYEFGFAPVPILALLFAVLVCRLFLGLRAMAWGLALTVGSFLVLALTPYWGAKVRPNLLLPDEPSSWLRAAAEYLCLACPLVVLVGHVVRRVEDAQERAEETLEQLRAEQQARSEAHLELMRTQAALARAQKLRTVGQLAAGVGHDFNNTLQVVLSWSHLLLEDARPDQREALHHIQQAATRGREMPRRLLALGRRDAAALQILDAAAACDGLLDSMRRLFPEHITIERRLQQTPPISVDPSHLEQILLNLAINARDAMSAGGTLRVVTETCVLADLPTAPSSHQTTERWAHLSIGDTGVGIAPDVMPHIFEPFFTTKGDGGSGLGLATVETLVERSGGVILVDSEPGRGTVFHVYLPESTGRAARPRAARAASRAQRAAVILVAEDDVVIRGVIRRILTRAGHTVLECDNALIARNLVAQHPGPIDLLCTDGIMPGGGTSALIESYRERYPEGEVLICSGYLPEELTRQQVDARGCGFLAKPFSPEELLGAVTERMEGWRVRAESA